MYHGLSRTRALSCDMIAYELAPYCVTWFVSCVMTQVTNESVMARMNDSCHV